MRIGIVVDNEFDNDIRVSKQAKLLRQAGNQVHVLCFGFDQKKYNDENSEYLITRIRISRKKKNLLFFLFIRFHFYERMWKNEVKNFILESKLESIVGHDLYMSKAISDGIRKSQLNIPFTLDLHENFPAAIQSYSWTKGLLRNFIVKPKDWEKRERQYLIAPSKIIVLSEEYKTLLLHNYKELIDNNIFIYPNLVDLEQFKKYENDLTLPRNKEITLFYFGAVAKRRGVFQTIEVFDELVSSGYALKLLIIGPIDKADKNEFYSSIKELSQSKQIEYVPWIDISELNAYLKIADICLAPFIKNPQHDSGVANKIFQYMFGKKPIVASNCIPQETVINKYKCGLVFSTKQEYKNSILELLSNKEKREVMGNNAYNGLLDLANNSTFDVDYLNFVLDK